MSVKPIMLSDATSYVSVDDPAIDWHKTAEGFLEQDRKAKLDRFRQIVASQSNPKTVKTLAELVDKAEAHDTDCSIEVVKWLSIDASKKRPSATCEIYKVKDGEKLTRYIIGVIPPGERARIIDECAAKPSELYWRAFIAGLRDIENFGGKDEKIPKRNIDGTEYVEPTWLRQRFGRKMFSVADEIGHVVWAWNELGDDDVKN